MKKKLCLLIVVNSSLLFASAQNKINRDTIDPKLTEVWSPVPPIVTPGKTSNDAPSDAVILFDGKNLDQWRSARKPDQPAGWTVNDGMFTVKKGTGDIQTKESFLDYQLHLEWRIPEVIHGENQARGNSGLFLSTGGEGDGYEIQILDCYINKTYVNGQTASVYKQAIPLANACKKPGEWQTYDVIWTAPRFNDDGSLKTPARVTVIHNGVLMQNNTELKGETTYRGQPYYTKHEAKPIRLQDHGDPSEPISFRNIWLRKL